jgi:hypothetical protein
VPHGRSDARNDEVRDPDTDEADDRHAFVKVGAALLLVACGGHAAKPPQHAPKKIDAGAAIVDAAVEAGPSKLELLGAKHDRIAPGTREILLRDIDAAKETDVSLPAFEADTCVRVAFDADAPTAITLQDARAMTLATVDASEGMLGPTGPVCFRKGDVATLRFTGQSHVRLAVWASP